MLRRVNLKTPLIKSRFLSVSKMNAKVQKRHFNSIRHKPEDRFAAVGEILERATIHGRAVQMTKSEQKKFQRDLIVEIALRYMVQPSTVGTWILERLHSMHQSYELLDPGQLNFKQYCDQCGWVL